MSQGDLQPAKGTLGLLEFETCSSNVTKHISDFFKVVWTSFIRHNDVIKINEAGVPWQASLDQVHQSLKCTCSWGIT